MRKPTVWLHQWYTFTKRFLQNKREQTSQITCNWSNFSYVTRLSVSPGINALLKIHDYNIPNLVFHNKNLPSNIIQLVAILKIQDWNYLNTCSLISSWISTEAHCWISDTRMRISRMCGNVRFCIIPPNTRPLPRHASNGASVYAWSFFTAKRKLLWDHNSGHGRSCSYPLPQAVSVITFTRT